MQNRKRRAAAGILTMILIVTGCRKNPDSPVVANKDFDEMIEQAEQTEAVTTEVSELACDSETYQTDIKDENMYVSVHVDAKVEVPDAEKLSVYRVEQQEISQDFLNQVREVLVGDRELYDGASLDIETKSDIEQIIGAYQESIETVQNSSGYTDDDRKLMIVEYQSGIDREQAKYESAPDVLDVTQYPIDQNLRNAAEAYAIDPDDSYIQWQYSLNETGSFYYGVSDAKDGNYIILYAQNNESYGNKICFEKSKEGYVFHNGVLSGRGCDNYACVSGDFVWPAEEELPELDESFMQSDSGWNWDNLQETEDETLTIEQEDAQAQADALIEQLGLDDYKCCYSGAVKQIPDIRWRKEAKTDTSPLYYRQVYAFSYVRNIDGVNLMNMGGAKFTDGWQGDSYVKKLWGGEGITVLVNDDGIVSFEFDSPLEVTETVVEQSNVKSFEDAKSVFEQMITTVYASEDEDSAYEITVERVALHYARISEANSFDTGLLVPVWDFIGTISEGGMNYQENVAVLSVNAIDGSVINGELGY